MSDSIQWPRAKYWDKAWNPMIGCKPCSPACENCYAAAWARRFGQLFAPHATMQRPPRKGVVFCGNMTDLFGEWVYDSDVNDNIASTLGYSHKATYLWLTKRVARMCNALSHGRALLKDDTPEGVDLFPFRDCEMCNQYFGFTAENQDLYDCRRIEMCVNHAPQWANYWLSAEPLLGPIDLLRAAGNKMPPFKWVVVGCESGPKRRPCKIEWVESIVEQCMVADVPVFVKQLDINGRCVTDINKFSAHLRIRQVPWATTGGGAE